MTVYSDLKVALKISPLKGEDKARYLDRLAIAVGKLDDTQFEALSEEAQTWANKAITDHNAKQHLDEPEGLEPMKTASGAKRTPKTPTAEAAEAATKKTTAAKKAATTAKKASMPAKVNGKAAAKPAKEKKVAKAAGSTASAFVRMTVIANREISRKDVAAACAKKGFELKDSSLNTQVNWVKQICDDIEAAGHWRA